VLAPGGIIFPDKANVYIAAIEDGDYKDQKINWWDRVYGFDMSCIKKLAYLEPLVDTVDHDALVTNAVKIFSVDIHKVKLEELAWTAQFSLKASRNDYIHAFVVYFDIEFSKCHKPIRFSTGPEAKYTHWKQTVFYLEDVVIINQGDTISGEIKSTPNAKNPRDLDITLKVDYDGKHSKVHRTQFYRLR